MTVSRSLLLCSAFVLGAWVVLNGPPLIAQSAPSTSTSAGAGSAALPGYEVATIKPGSTDGRMMMMFTMDGVSIHGISMQMILREAFNTEDDHIVGAPAWTRNTRYDVEAKVAADDVPKLKDMKADDRKAMLVPLLVDRFGLKYHHETREMTTYSLVVARSGVKMKESAADPAPLKDPPPNGSKPELKGHMLRMMGPGRIESEGTTTNMLAHLLSQQLGKTVVDKTGLTARYDYTLQWTPDDAPPPGAPGAGPAGAPAEANAPDTVGPSLFTAVEEQLGLKLESSKGMVDVIVIDHMEAPSAN